MLKQLKPSILMLLWFTVITGLLYPLLTTGLAQLTMPGKANGSLIVKDGKVIGSELIGQNFTAGKYMWGRLSATSPYPYNAVNSVGSNLGPLNPALGDAAKARIDALAKAAQEAGVTAGPAVPIDLITASGSGLDAEISVAAAEYQAARIAKVRGLSEAQVRDVIRSHATGKWLGVFGEARVNVLQVNLSLDQIKA